jgi:hypothetical protein
MQHADALAAFLADLPTTRNQEELAKTIESKQAALVTLNAESEHLATQPV